jgi:hypothetical protein
MRSLYRYEEHAFFIQIWRTCVIHTNMKDLRRSYKYEEHALFIQIWRTCVVHTNMKNLRRSYRYKEHALFIQIWRTCIVHTNMKKMTLINHICMKKIIYHKVIYYECCCKKSMNICLQFFHSSEYLDSRMFQFMIFIQNHSVKSWCSFVHVSLFILLFESFFHHNVDDTIDEDVVCE